MGPLALIVLLSACATSHPGESYVSAQLGDGDAALIAKTIANFTASTMPPAQSIVSPAAVYAESTAMGSDVLQNDLAIDLRLMGFGVAVPSDTSGGIHRLSYQVTPVDNAVLVRMTVDQNQASQEFARNPMGNLDPASALTVSATTYVAPAGYAPPSSASLNFGLTTPIATPSPVMATPLNPAAVTQKMAMPAPLGAGLTSVPQESHPGSSYQTADQLNSAELASSKIAAAGPAGPPALSSGVSPIMAVGTTSSAPPQAQTWVLAKDTLIGFDITKMAKTAGWTVLWRPQKDWPVVATATFQGNFKTAAGQILQDLADQGVNISYKAYDGNNTLVVFQPGQSDDH